MNETTLSSRNFLTLALYCVLCLILGYVYVSSFNMGIRVILVVHGLALFFFFAALSITDLKSSLVFAMILAIPMVIDFNLVRYPLEAGFPVFSDGITISLVDCFLMVLLFQWLASSSITRKHQRLTVGHPIGTLVLVWIFFSLLVGWLRARQFVYSLFEVVTLLQGFLVYFYLVNNTTTVRDLKVVIYALFAALSLESLWLIFQYITGLNYTLKGVYVAPVRDVVGFRSTGFTTGEVLSTQMIAFLAPVVLAYYFGAADRIRRIMAAAMILIFMVGILCAQTRAAGIAALVGFVVVLALGRLRGWISTGRILKFVSVALLFLIVASPYVYHRFQKGAGSWEEARVPLIRTAVDMWADNWLLGVGPSNYNFNMEKYVPVQLRHTWKWAVHNEILLQLTERGIIGAFLYYWFLWIMYIKLWGTMRSSNQWVALASVGILAGLIGSMPMRVVHPYHGVPVYLFYCVMLALTVAMDNMERERLDNATEPPTL